MFINQFVISFQLEVLQMFQRLAAQSQWVPHNVVLQGESCRRYQVGIVLLHQGGNVSGGKQGVQPLVGLVGKEQGQVVVNKISDTVDQVFVGF